MSVCLVRPSRLMTVRVDAFEKSTQWKILRHDESSWAMREKTLTAARYTACIFHFPTDCMGLLFESCSLRSKHLKSLPYVRTGVTWVGWFVTRSLKALKRRISKISFISNKKHIESVNFRPVTGYPHLMTSHSIIRYQHFYDLMVETLKSFFTKNR